MNNRDMTIEEFIRINDRVLCADEGDWYGYTWCGLWPDGVDEICISKDNVSISYQIPYEDWVDTWELPKIYFDMSDEEIIAHAKAKYEQEEKEQLECRFRNDIKELASLADKLGYDLVKRED